MCLFFLKFSFVFPTGVCYLAEKGEGRWERGALWIHDCCQRTVTVRILLLWPMIDEIAKCRSNVIHVYAVQTLPHNAMVHWTVLIRGQFPAAVEWLRIRIGCAVLHNTPVADCSNENVIREILSLHSAMNSLLIRHSTYSIQRWINYSALNNESLLETVHRRLKQATI